MRAITPTLAIAAAIAMTSLAEAQVLYITDGDAAVVGSIDVSLGGAITATSTHSGGYPIVVHSNSMWIGDYFGDSIAYQYALDGTATGNSNRTSLIQAVDAAYDPDSGIAYHLANAFSPDGVVYSSNGELHAKTFAELFPVGVKDDRFVGITYDTQLDSLWISAANSIYQFTTTGDLVSSFANPTGDGGALAYDQSTDTLWMVARGGFLDTLLQFDKDGNLLNTVNFKQDLGFFNAWGAEFLMQAAAVAELPEPTSVAIWAIAGVAVAGLVWRRRK